jgi:hypothetical protein
MDNRLRVIAQRLRRHCSPAKRRDGLLLGLVSFNFTDPLLHCAEQCLYLGKINEQIRKQLVVPPHFCSSFLCARHSFTRCHSRNTGVNAAARELSGIGAETAAVISAASPSMRWSINSRGIAISSRGRWLHRLVRPEDKQAMQAVNNECVFRPALSEVRLRLLRFCRVAKA